MTLRVRAVMYLLVGFICACALACGFSAPAFAQESQPTPATYFDYEYIKEGSPAASCGEGVYIWRLSKDAYDEVERAGGVVLPDTVEVGGVDRPVVAAYLSAEGLGSLDATQCRSLRYLECWGSLERGSVLKAAGCASLERLDCGRNYLRELDLSGCTSLEYLDCSHNELTSLDVTGCPLTETFNCSYNNLSAAALESLEEKSEASVTKTAPQYVSIEGAMVTFGSCVYDGRDWCGNHASGGDYWRSPKISVKMGDVVLKQDVHYALECHHVACDAGAYSVRVYGIGEFNGEVNAEFTVEKASLTEPMVSLPQGSYAYDGSEKLPKPSVAVNGVKQDLSAYEVTYWSADGKRVDSPKDLGAYVVRVTAKDSANTFGTVEKGFAIESPEDAAKANASKKANRSIWKSIWAWSAK